MNKAVRDACTGHRELCARAATELEITRLREMTTDHEVAHLAYLAAHGPEIPLNYNEAIQSPYGEPWQRKWRKNLIC